MVQIWQRSISTKLEVLSEPTGKGGTAASHNGSDGGEGRSSTVVPDRTVHSLDASKSIGRRFQTYYVNSTVLGFWGSEIVKHTIKCRPGMLVGLGFLFFSSFG